jgi:hypothetical protein
MEKLNFPEYEFKIKPDSKGTQIFDIVRKKYVLLTPEEWVRQHAILFLHFERDYPLSLMKVEKEISVNQLLKRFDLLCYDNKGKPLLLCEFKRAELPINESTFEQIARYNLSIQAPLVYVSNGLKHFIAEVNFSDKSHVFLKEIPNYDT